MKRITSQKGFTIIETGIAMLAFSVILLIIVYGVIHFTASYYKGINNSRTQVTARTIVDAIAQDIQFGDTTSQTTPGVTNGWFCAGGKLYQYTEGTQVSGTPGNNNWGLYRYNSSGCGNTGGSEMLGDNMRLINLDVHPSAAGSNVWSVSVKVAYGAADLLCTPNSNLTGGCNAGAASYQTTDSVIDPNTICKSDTGQQFCAVASLSTSVAQRLQGSE